MKLRPLSRRTVLRGIGGVSVGLPLLEAMAPERRSFAQTAAPKRLLVYYTPGGTVRDAWLPTGTESDFQLSPILAPLEDIKDQLLILDGLDMKVTVEGHGHPHSRGMGAVLTGQPLAAGPYETCRGLAGLAEGPSLDQVLSERLKVGRKLSSLEVAINWPTDRRDGGKAAPTNCINYSAANQGVPMAVDPRQVWERLFQDLGQDAAGQMAEAEHRLSLLDAVAEEYRQLIPRLGKSDRLKLEEHLTRIQELERSAAIGPATMTPDCVPPEAPEPLADASAGQVGAPGEDTQYNTILDAAMPEIGKTMMDLVATAFACDLTAVATLQWTDSQCYNTLPWLGLHENHHAYQHGSGYQPEILKSIYTWYTEQFRYMLDALQQRNLLEETIVLWVSEIQHPKTHAQENMPFVLAGGGGAISTGRFLQYAHLPHNDLLCAVGNLFGLELQSFGKPDYCTGPLSGLV
jgi:hypothetical protein